MNKLSWTTKKIDDDLLPLMKRINDHKIQKPIEAYFTFEAISNVMLAKKSKRMQNAISSLKKKQLPDDDDLKLSSDDDVDDQDLIDALESVTSSQQSNAKRKSDSEETSDKRQKSAAKSYNTRSKKKH